MKPLEVLLGYLDEDCPDGDITSEAVVPDVICNAYIKAENDGIIAGLEEAILLFSHFEVKVNSCARDGDVVHREDRLLNLNGSARTILLLERTVLNIIGRMSGIATQTRRMADTVSAVNPKCRVAATRKTCPGFRIMDKKAVIIGGGEPHRYTLSDGFLIKDNHLVLVPLGEAVRAAKKATLYKKVEVEVESPEAALEAARAGADIILLDNMSYGNMRITIDSLRQNGLREHVIIELSGGITEQSIKEFASLDLDVISMGALTHTVRNFSVNLEIVPVS
jgi:nicotinate-nucleotide pyrophosphorylase (carboxylating)